MAHKFARNNPNFPISMEPLRMMLRPLSQTH